MDSTRTVRVTLTYADTLTRGVGRESGAPWIVHVLSYADTLTRGLGRESGDPWIVHVLSELL